MKAYLVFIILGLGCKLAAQTDFPDVYAITTQFERIEIIRLQNGTDLLEGLKQALLDKNIRNGVILAGIGSVTDYHIHVVTSRELPPANEFSKAAVPMDVISVQGYIFNQRIHAHISLSDENSMIGGHVEPGTKVLTFLIITVGVLTDEIKMEDLDRY